MLKDTSSAELHPTTHSSSTYLIHPSLSSMLIDLQLNILYSFGSTPFLKWLETEESQHPNNNIKIAWTRMVGTPNEYSGQTLVLERWILETSSWNWILRSRPGMLFASPTGYETVKNIRWKMPSKCPTKIGKGACPSAKAATWFDIHHLLATLKISFSKTWICYREHGNISVGGKKESGASFLLCPVLYSIRPSVSESVLTGALCLSAVT